MIASIFESLISVGGAVSRGTVESLKSALSGLRSCRLCWRITLAFLLVFGALEFLFLDLSTDRYRAEQLGMVEREALVVARTILRASDPTAQRDFAETGSLLRDNSVLVGLETFSESGRPLGRFGETVLLRPDTESLTTTTRRIVHEDLRRMEVVWPPSRLHAPFFVTALIDIDQIDGLVEAYRDRMVWSYVLLALVSTIAAMAVLEVLVLRPIRSLGAAMRAAAMDPSRAGAVRLDSVGKDELADIAVNFHALTGHVCGERAARRDTRAEGREVDTRSASEMPADRLSRARI